MRERLLGYAQLTPQKAGELLTYSSLIRLGSVLVFPSHNEMPRADGRYDPYWAGAASALLHLSILLLALIYVSGSGGGANNSVSGSRALKASVEPAEEFRQKINLTSSIKAETKPPTTAAGRSIPTPQKPREDDFQESNPPPIAAPSGHGEDDGSSRIAAVAAPSQSAATSVDGSPDPTGENGGLGGSGLREAYLAAVRSVILTKWGKTGIDLKGCVLHLQQKTGGTVQAVKVDGCTLDAAARDELEAATLMAQPLPYAGYEKVFSEQLELDL